MENKITSKDFTITNLNEGIATIYPKNKDIEYRSFDNLVLDFGKKEKGDLTTCNFLFESSDYKITATSSSCGCTSPTFRSTENENVQHVTISFDSSKITNNVSKVATLYLNNNKKALKFNLVINKP